MNHWSQTDRLGRTLLVVLPLCALFAASMIVGCGLIGPWANSAEGGTVTQNSPTASAAGDHSNALSLSGSGGPLLIAVVVFILAFAWVCVAYIRSQGERRQLRRSLTKLMQSVEAEGAKSVKTRFARLTCNDNKVRQTIEDILESDVRPYSCFCFRHDPQPVDLDDPDDLEKEDEGI